MDIGRAYTFVTSDPKWISKILIGAAISVVPILNIALYGYALEIVKRVYRGSDLPLPEWDDFGDYLIRGLLVFLGLLIWQLPLLLLSCPIILLAIISDSSVMLVLGLACVVPFAIIFYGVIGQVVVARYAIGGEFSSMFDFTGIVSDARRGIGILLLAILIYIVASILGSIAGVVTCGIGFFVIGPWLIVAQAHLLGQAYREISSVPPMPAESF